MRSVFTIARDWSRDVLLRRVARNSGYLLASNVISALLSLVTANLLGVEGFGVLGLTTGFVSAVNRLLSFRMGDLVVRYLGEYMARKEYDRGAALVKAAGLIEGITSLAAYGILLLLVPVATRYFVKDPLAVTLVPFYGLTILGNLTTETATGVLQVGNHYRSQALINLIQAILTALMIVWAAITHAGLVFVVTAYLLGKMILGLGPIVLALFSLREMLGPGWWRAPFSLLPPWREMARFGLATNFNMTITMLARDNEVTWVGFFFSPLQAGYFKTALAIVNLIIMPINPFISTSYPEITRAIVSREWARLRNLLRQVTAISGAWTLGVSAVLLLFGQQILFQTWPILGHNFRLYRPEFAPAFPVLLILLVGFGFANIVFWNRSLLLAFDHPDYPLKVAFWAMLAKVALAFLLIWGLGWGYQVEAVLLSGYFLVTVGLTLWKGLAYLRQKEVLQPVGAEL